MSIVACPVGRAPDPFCTGAGAVEERRVTLGRDGWPGLCGGKGVSLAPPFAVLLVARWMDAPIDAKPEVDVADGLSGPDEDVYAAAWMCDQS